MGALRRLLGGLAALLLAGCAVHGADRHAALPPGAIYVAMGSSFAAGPGLPPFKAGAPARCQRSIRNYASLLADRLGVALVDVSCGGATTTHVLEGWSELPPQIDAVAADTRLVTLTIGGNDVHYVRNLMAASCPPGAGYCPSRGDASEADWTRDEANLRAIVREIRRRAPQARIVFVDYIALLPESGSCAVVAMPAADLEAGRATAARLAQLTARVAREEGAELVSAAALSRRHTACDPEPWSVGAAVVDEAAGGILWHPNARGMAGVADALTRMLSSSR